MFKYFNTAFWPAFHSNFALNISNIFKRWIYCWWVAGTMPVDVSGSLCTKGPPPLISETSALVSSFQLCLAQIQPEVSSQSEMFLWVFMSVLKPREFAQVFSQGFRMKRGAGSLYSCPPLTARSFLPPDLSELRCRRQC